MKWMIKDKALDDYLQACKYADVNNIEGDAVLMRMFNTKERYLAHMNNIVKQFGSLDGLRICEIGGGYGALAKMIYDVFEPPIYHIIDLPEVCELQQRYLVGYPVQSFAVIQNQDYDLVISNYALSEVIDNKPYIDGVLRRSKHGYITCNTDMVQLDFPHSRLPDIPGERKTNYILVW